MKIATEYFTDITLSIGDTYGDDVRGGDGGGGRGGRHGGGQAIFMKIMLDKVIGGNGCGGHRS